MTTSRLSIVIIVVSLALVSSSRGLAQSDTVNSAPFSYGWAFDFGIISNLQVSSFLGSTVSLSRYMSPEDKIRFGVSVSLRNNDDDFTYTISHNDSTTYRAAGSSTETSQSVGLALQYLSYSQTSSRTSLFLGIGPAVRYDWSKTTTVDTGRGSSFPRIIHSNSRSLGVGFLASAGVEWFLSDRLSLHAEYGLQFYYSWRSSSSDDTYYNYYYTAPTTDRYARESSGHGWTLTGSTVLFGMSVRF